MCFSLVCGLCFRPISECPAPWGDVLRAWCQLRPPYSRDTCQTRQTIPFALKGLEWSERWTGESESSSLVGLPARAGLFWTRPPRPAASQEPPR